MAIDRKNNGAYAFLTNDLHFNAVIESYFEKTGDTHVWSRIEGRTRSSNYNEALSFKIFDPLWMLTRQWQYGRFKGNDCGTPVSVKISTSRKKLHKNDRSSWVSKEYSPETPMEYDVEKQNFEITPYVRVESAMQLKKKLVRNGFTDLCSQLEREFPLQDYYNNPESAESLEKVKNQKNKTLKKFSAFFTKRSFDGYNVCNSICDNSIYNRVTCNEDEVKKIFKEYTEWFKKKFLPNNDSSINHWNTRKLGYEVEMQLSEEDGNIKYTTDNYATGTLSWYSFDGSGDVPSSENEKKTWTTIPTPATFPGAPAQRLWEFEDKKVWMGNGSSTANTLAEATVMQYISMYSNDWMITPVEAETGTVINVKDILVRDSFDNEIHIKESAEELDNKEPKTSPINRWSLFGTTKPNAYAENDFSINKGLVCPPTVLRCEEGAPVEEVQFLRDEMANMVWGVETKINDGCGGTMDGKTLSDSVLEEIDREEKKSQKTEYNKSTAKYSLLIQNRVPLNWIPFIPQQMEDGRNIVLRRAKMPIYYQEGYQPTRPSTDLLGKPKEQGQIKPFIIDEDQFGGYGFKVIKTAQRTRWFNGKSFTWLGNRKVISEYQANSGLMFDELIRTSNGKQIENQNIVTEKTGA